MIKLNVLGIARLTIIILAASPSVAADPAPDLKRDGAFGFPQAKATVLVERKDLRLSVWNNATYLYVQAIVKDNDAEGTDFHKFNGREFKDKSDLLLDLNNDGKKTANVDRYYPLNPYVEFPGLRYVIPFGKETESGMYDNSQGRGAIRFVELGEDRKLRVDCYLIPLAELKKKPGDTIRLAIWAHSPKPKLTFNSVGFERERDYASSDLPWDKFHAYKLSSSADPLDLKLVPEDKKTVPPLALKPTSDEQKAKVEGAFGFPKSEGVVLCDNDELRLRVWNNKTHLYVQAILWQDDDKDAAVFDMGRQYKDNSALLLDLDSNRRLTPKVDRDYVLNPNTSNTGLKYSYPLTATTFTSLLGDSKGRGSRGSLEIGKERSVRVDCFFLPLDELKKKPGDTIRLAYWAISSKPKFRVNSVGFKSDRPYYSNQLPLDKFHDVKLAARDEPFDPEQVPNDERRNPD